MTSKNILLIQIIPVGGVSHAVLTVGFSPTNYVWMPCTLLLLKMSNYIVTK